MDERTNTFIAECYLRGKTSRDYCDWAVECLEDGLDTKNIRILSSMFIDGYSYETEDYFRKGLKDLGWEFPSEEECLRRYGKLIAKRIVKNEIEPFEGLSVMQGIYYDSDYNDDFVEWGYLYVHEYSMTEKEFIAEIKKEAENFLRGGKVKNTQEVEENPVFVDKVNDEKEESVWSKILKQFS